ncbi:MAG: 50S ribosomal protein L11 methyltransferase, partial [Gammaproteobacteria bacterium]
GTLPPHEFSLLEEREWSREWLKDFKPMRFGRRLWIVPSACAPPDATAVNIRLDPGLAFGTGAHATTALCLEWLDGTKLTGKTVIDYGCGSGILAIAAALLGALHVWAVDNDPQALTATQDNAARNRVISALKISLPDQLPVAKADVLLSNILAAPLVELAPCFAAHLKSGGSLVLSGILDSQRDEIHNAYAPWFQFAGDMQSDGWVRMDGLRLPEDR